MKPHEKHAAMADAFHVADSNTPRDKVGNGKFGFAKTGMPISPAREAAVKKAAATSAANRSAAADARNATAPDLGQAKATSSGGLGLNKPKGIPIKKGLLGL